ncbi:tetratricopeptide repeat protein [Streptosporangium sp. CA-135522]|uniref:AfsR/SARP family transcriptional regulator n=1 Tax=Streptosporangium sp. CA-135522 TaxID=3240072 RepID=UPI003D93947E
MGVRFALLGPVEVRVGNGQPPSWAPRHRALLAYLLLHAGTAVSTERLIGALWGSTPPDTARAQIHSLVAAVRQGLRQAGAEQALQSHIAGYVIHVEPGQLDVADFTQQAEADDAGQLRQALALWRGEPLADIRADYAEEARRRLHERRLRVVERLAELDLAAGRHAEILDELAAEVVANPLRERLTGQLMLALHRAGRQAEALAAGRAYRSLLAEQQGLDPGRAFTALEQAILRDEPELAPPPGPSASPPPAQRVSYLPYDIPDFTGRADEVDTLIHSWSPGSGVVAISAIDGMPGVGKTTLAIHAAHLLADGFPDGQLFVDLHAHTPGQAPVEPTAALETLMRQLGLAAEQIPAELADRAARWRAELTGRRALIVVDNAAGTEQVRPLLPGTTASLMLITSRRRLIDLDGVQPLSMDLPAAQEASELFTGIVGERASADPVAVLDVLHLCGFLPLAVRIAAARLRHRPRWSVRYLADRLRDQRRRLTELATAERGVAAAFALSYQQLDPEQQRVFRLLGLHPGTDLDAHTAAALADLPLEEAETILEDLLDAHMLLQHQPGRYTMHDLVRQYARDLHDPADSGRQALTRMFGHYLHTADTAVDLLTPSHRGLRPAIPDPGTPPLPLTDASDAAAWLETERPNLLAVAAHTAEHGRPDLTASFATTLHRYLMDRCLYSDAITLHTHALTAALTSGEQADQAGAHANLGEAHWARGDYEQAQDCYLQSLRLHRDLGNRAGQARLLNNLGGLAWQQRDYTQALEYYQASLALCRELGIRVGEAAGLANLGIVYDRQGHYEQAHQHLSQALTLHRELGDRRLQATALDNLGLVHRHQGHYTQALDHHRQALDLYRDIGHQDGQADASNGLGEAARAMGEPAQALTHHNAALTLATEVGSRLQQARAHDGLARAHADLADLGTARAHASQALELYTDLGVPEADDIRQLIADLDTLPGDQTPAAQSRP